MSKEKPELKNGDQTYRVNSDNLGLPLSELYSGGNCDDATDDYEIPF
ncbi:MULTISPECIES: hypothetical protein [Terrisporobacter]|nr:MULTISPECIES: hypothetical protein [Terrisporobacter]